MTDLSLDISPEEAEKINELEVMIPSETTRKFVQETGCVISEPSRAKLIMQSEAPLSVRCALLERLAASAVDDDLRREIRHFLSSLRSDLEVVRTNTESRFVYMAMSHSDPERSEPRLFADFEPALAWALKYYTGEAFALCRELIQSSSSAVQDRACLEFSETGRLMDFHKDRADAAGTPAIECPEFMRSLCEVPNPFGLGDIVWLPGRNEYGVVEALPAVLSEPNGPGGSLDSMETRLRVVFMGHPDGPPKRVGEFGAELVSPIHLERYEPAGWDAGFGFDGMLLALQQLCRGTGSIETLRRYAEQHRSYREATEAAAQNVHIRT